ncbi:iron chelate uptake ABC transporter family permease subunit [uncultured Sphaerochaeta sp.]|uniref:ABC transporter permease n=1 Tax=uncultured Sphaerochaeta sp. TaxID=886478 RepID=UPI0029CA04D4|nr:iron chelate uptake ABC transporter family permease subunit [uncultured Sphaerochaeta sp.]
MSRFVLPISVLIFSIFSLFIGVIPLELQGILSMDSSTMHLLFVSRLPRVISLLISGMSLATAGAIMQLLTSNRFVTPSTGSTTEWAKLGLLTAMMLFPTSSLFSKSLFTFLFAFLGTLSFLYLLRKLRLKEPMVVPLIGILYGNIINALSTYIAYQMDLIQSLQSWVQGNFALILKGRYEILYISIPCFIIAALFANRFTVVAMGKDVASTLGVRYMVTVQIGLVIVSVISALVLVIVGVIPFVGLVIPNMVSLFKGDNLEKNIWTIAFSGGLFLLVCDTLSRLLIHPFEIPIGVTASVLGCVLFIGFLFYRRHHAA